VLARAGRPFLKNGLPMLLGMALAFTAVATLAAVGGGWAVQANEYGRIAALGLLAVFALTLMFPALADRLSRPLVALGARIAASSDGGALKDHAFAVVAAAGRGHRLAVGAVRGAGAGPDPHGRGHPGRQRGHLAVAAGLCGRRGHLAGACRCWSVGGSMRCMRRSLGVSQWARRGMGAAVLAGVVLIATGLDTGLLSQLSLSSTSRIEQKLINVLKPQGMKPAMGGVVDPEAPAPEAMPLVAAKLEMPQHAPQTGTTGLSRRWPARPAGSTHPPLTAADLRGKVVLVDFWTYSCINCLRTLPYIRAWADKYKDAGLVVVGVHSPEFAFEKNEGNVRKAVKDLGITYPVAIDSHHAIWRGFHNQAWPALYFVDAQGRVRHQVLGEGQYEESERLIQKLLAENGKGRRGCRWAGAAQGEGDTGRAR
jgi:thiol-disulfide isomerase/thioredoxin